MRRVEYVGGPLDGRTEEWSEHKSDAELRMITLPDDIDTDGWYKSQSWRRGAPEPDELVFTWQSAAH